MRGNRGCVAERFGLKREWHAGMGGTGSAVGRAVSGVVKDSFRDERRLLGTGLEVFSQSERSVKCRTRGS